MRCIDDPKSATRMLWIRPIILPRTLFCFLLLLLLPYVSTVAEPKGFTEDPYVDDEKFREKGEILT